MRVASAVGDGATAVRLVHEYLAAPLAANSAGTLEMTWHPVTGQAAMNRTMRGRPGR